MAVGRSKGMDSPVRTEYPADESDQIDELMAMPIKPPPAVTVFGDDAVVGFTPVPLPDRAQTA